MPRLGSKVAKAKLKVIGGSLYKWWSVWFNSIIRVLSYQRGCHLLLKTRHRMCRHKSTGTAWLSSVRVVESYIHLLNERNLRVKYHFYIIFLTLVKRRDDELNVFKYYLLLEYKALAYNIYKGLEEEKEKSSRYGLYVLGYSFATKAKTIGYNREI
jgi:hypothetical protein